MERRFIAWCGLTVLTVMLGCSQGPKQSAGTHDTDVQAVKDTEAQWNKDYQAKDADKVTAYYTDDAVLIAPGSAPANGKEAIRASMKQFVSDPALSLQFQPSLVDVASSGDVAYTQGSYTLTVTDPTTKKPVNDHGSYVTVYKKQSDGSWKAVLDIVSSAGNMAPQPAKT